MMSTTASHRAARTSTRSRYAIGACEYVYYTTQPYSQMLDHRKNPLSLNCMTMATWQSNLTRWKATLARWRSNA